MTKNTLAMIARDMNSLGLNYSFMVFNDVPSYPYFVGAYTEVAPNTEDGYEETSFTITGFTRGTWSELEEVKAKIKKLYHPINGRSEKHEDGSVSHVFYMDSFLVPKEDEELKSIQIDLTVKEWVIE